MGKHTSSSASSESEENYEGFNKKPIDYVTPHYRDRLSSRSTADSKKHKENCKKKGRRRRRSIEVTIRPLKNEDRESQKVRVNKGPCYAEKWPSSYQTPANWRILERSPPSAHPIPSATSTASYAPKASFDQQESTNFSNASYFPFRKTESGNLKISPENVAFQNKNISVLVTNPHSKRISIQEDFNFNTISVAKMESPPIPPLPDTEEDRSSQKYQNNNFVRDSKRERFDQIEKSYRNDEAYCESMRDLDENSPMAFRSDLMENIHYRIKRAIHPDTKIIIGNQEFPVHSIILESCSNYFDKLRRPKENLMRVELPQGQICPQDFTSLMDWILIEKESKGLLFSSDNVVGLFAIASYLEIPDLKYECVNFIKEKVEAEDPKVVKMFEEARKRKCTELVKILSARLAILFPTIYKSRQFLNLSYDELNILLDADAIKIKSELDVYDAAVRWLLFDWGNRSPYTVKLMSIIRFGLLKPLQLTQICHCAEAASLPDYAKIYSFPEVKKMVQDGLTYSIFKENYGNRPGELNRWLFASGVTPPRDRHNLEVEPDHNRLPAKVSFDANEDKTANESDNEKETLEGRNEDLREAEIPINRRGKWKCKKMMREKAATVIQCRMRGFLARKRFKRIKQMAQLDDAKECGRNHKLKDVSSTKIELNLLLLGGIDTYRKYSLEKNNGSNMFKYNRERNEWQLGGSLPEPRFFGGAVTLNGLVFIFGGFDLRKRTKKNNCIPSGTTWTFDPSNGSWTKLGDMIIPRAKFGYVEYQGSIFAFGGCDYAGRPLSSCEMYDPESDLWVQISSMDRARISTAVAVYNSEIWIIGGLTKDPSTPILNTTIAYDPYRDRWSNKPNLPKPKCFASAFSVHNQLYLIGGAGTRKRNSKPKSQNSVYLFDKKLNCWRKVGELNMARHAFASISLGKYIVIVSGSNSDCNTLLNTVEVYNTEKGRSTERMAKLPSKLAGSSLVLI